MSFRPPEASFVRGIRPDSASYGSLQRLFGGGTMNLAVYGIGYLLVIAGVAYLAHLLRIPQAWIGAIVLVLAGIGVLSAARMMKGGGSV